MHRAKDLCFKHCNFRRTIAIKKNRKIAWQLSVIHERNFANCNVGR